MSANDYRFRAVWLVGAATDRVFETLVDLAGWPRWWPDVRSVNRIDDDTAELTCRSSLPYVLTFQVRRTVQNPATGRLRVDMTGDLDGYTEGRVDLVGAAARLVIDQRVELTRPLLGSLTPVARPLLRANHSLMMRRGRRGLRTYLA